jgi:sirohydrochlorin ferrochelatase
MLPCFAGAVSAPCCAPPAQLLITSRRSHRIPAQRGGPHRATISRQRVACCRATAEPSICPAIVVVDHGSKRDAANNNLNDVIAVIRARSNGVPIYGAHMELANPTIAEAYAAAVRGGANHVIIVPFFLAPGRHVTSDIPALVSDAAQSHPGVTFDVRSPIGTHPAIADLVMERAGVVVRE